MKKFRAAVLLTEILTRDFWNTKENHTLEFGIRFPFMKYKRGGYCAVGNFIAEEKT
jgi:hypothetical protein